MIPSWTLTISASQIPTKSPSSIVPEAAGSRSSGRALQAVTPVLRIIIVRIEYNTSHIVFFIHFGLQSVTAQRNTCL